MTSIFQRALGRNFDTLHPQIQRKFAISSRDQIMSCGEGIMESVWKGRFYTTPFLHLGAQRNVLFAEVGTNVPIRLENYAYLDSFGRETMTWNRIFDFSTPRRFDESMIYSERRGCIVVYAGTHQHLAVEMRCWANDDGSLTMRTGTQRLYEWRIGIRFPILFSGIATVHLRGDAQDQRLYVDVRIANPIFGPIFGYRGWINSEVHPCPVESIPREARPVREEHRE